MLIESFKKRDSSLFKEKLEIIGQEAYDSSPVKGEEAHIASLEAQKEALLELLEEFSDYELDIS